MNELLTPAQCYEADRLAGTAGVPIEGLIDQAGRAVAEEILRRYGARPVVVLAGPGNNGRDGHAAARYLKRWGWPVTLSHNIGEARLIIDALYGAGLSRDFPQDLARSINTAGVPVVSIDLPSGLDGMTGQVKGAAVKADVTVTFLRKKPAHVLMPGRALCGETVVAPIGFPSNVLDAMAFDLWENNKPRCWPVFGLSANKFSKGHAVIFSGDALHSGASRLAAQAALKVGAGLVTLAGEAAALAVQASHVTAIMLAELSHVGALARLLEDPRKNAVLIGPAAGVGERTAAQVLAALESQAALVLDADALTSFQQSPEQLFESTHKRVFPGPVVMTPHEGEFSRLFKSLSFNSIAKVERARQAARHSGAIVLLKGADTVIASPDGRVVINSNAPASLATAGSGDVLAGLITGLLAQGMGGFEAACAGAWLHGETAKHLSPQGVTAESLVTHLWHPAICA